MPRLNEEYEPDFLDEDDEPFLDDGYDEDDWQDRDAMSRYPQIDAQ